MSEIRTCRKKLCDAGAAACVFAFIALLAAGLGAATEFIGREIYSSNFGQTDRIFAGDGVADYVSVYDYSIIMTVFALVVFIICTACAKRKKLGAEFGAVTSILPIVLGICISSRLYNVYQVYSDINDKTDKGMFYYVMALLVYALPLFSCAMLFICGVIIWGRCATDDFVVTCPVMKRVAQPIPQEAAQPTSQEAPVTPEVSPSFEFKNSNFEQSEQIETPPQPAEAVIPETTVCPSCGATAKAGAKFCPKCGMHL